MLSAKQVEQFSIHGFLLGFRALSEMQLDELRLEMQRVIDDRDDVAKPQPVLLRNLSSDDSPVWQIVNICDASAPFRVLALNREIAHSAATLLGARELRLWHDQIQYKPAGKGGVNMWHQDSPYWPILEPKDQQITAWIALDDADESNGCMSMVPGSHCWGNKIDFLRSLKYFDDMPDEFEAHPIKVHTCPVKAGWVHFHHPLTWHGSAANQSNRPRRAIALHYMTEKTIYKSSGDHPMKQFVESRDDEPITGTRFPTVYP